MGEYLQQIWFNSDNRPWSYIGVKMMFSFFLSICSRCGAPASWAAWHTTMYLHKVLTFVMFMVVCAIEYITFACFIDGFLFLVSGNPNYSHLSL